MGKLMAFAYAKFGSWIYIVTVQITPGQSAVYTKAVMIRKIFIVIALA